jgi:hypothetical protein
MFYNLGTPAIGGNEHDYNGLVTNGETLFNTVLSPSRTAMTFNMDSLSGATFIYRNTLVGRVEARGVGPGDGPFRLSNNVIVNSDSGTPSGSHILHVSVSDPSRIILSSNLVGYPADNIVDSQGRLTAAYASYVGTHGSQIGPSGPSAPTNLRIIR